MSSRRFRALRSLLHRKDKIEDDLKYPPAAAEFPEIPGEEARNIGVPFELSEASDFNSNVAERLQGFNPEIEEQVDRILRKSNLQVPTLESSSSFKDAKGEDVHEKSKTDGSDRLGCLPGTRREIFTQITGWVVDPDGDFIFCLYGKAGSGKSAIHTSVRSVYRVDVHMSFVIDGSAGSSGLCDVFKQVTYRLGIGIGVSGSSALSYTLLPYDRPLELPTQDSNSFAHVVESDVSEDEEHMPLNLARQRHGRFSRVLISIDLDGDHVDRDLGSTLTSLHHLKDGFLPNLRVFITTRPKLYVLKTLGELSISKKEHSLGVIDATTIEHDIRSYLQTRLRGSNLPIDTLVGVASPNFGIATQIIESALLGSFEPLGGSIELSWALLISLSKFYRPVLDGFSQRMKSQATEETMKAVLEAVVALREPLTPRYLSDLMNLNSDEVLDTLEALDAIYLIHRDSFLVSVHWTFRLIVTGQPYRAKLGLNVYDAHWRLSSSCIRHLSSPCILRKDPFDLSDTLTQHADINHIAIVTRITPDTTYACRYWIEHLSLSDDRLFDDGEIHEFMRIHFLHWLEAMIWLGKLDEVDSSLQKLQVLISDKGDPDLSTFLEDARTLVSGCAQRPQMNPLEIYRSPLRSMSPHIQTKTRLWLEQVETETTSMDENASAKKSRTPEGHTKDVMAMAFSPNGRVLASGSKDRTVVLWDIATGEKRKVLRDYSGAVVALAFSMDGRYLMTASDARDICIWDTSLGKDTAQTRLLGPEYTVISVSRSGPAMAITYLEGFVAIREVTTGYLTKLLTIDGGRIQSLALSPDGTRLAVSLAGELKLLDTESEKKIWSIKCSLFNSPKTIVFSPNGLSIGTIGQNGTVKLRNASSGAFLAEFEGHDNMVQALAFSPDARTILFVLTDGKKILWDLASGHNLATVEGSRRPVTALTFSPDGRRLLFSHKFGGIQRWALSEIQPSPAAGPSRSNYSDVMEQRRSRELIMGEEGTTLDIIESDTAIRHRRPLKNNWDNATSSWVIRENGTQSLSDETIGRLVISLFTNSDVISITIAALYDPEIGIFRFRYNAARLIMMLGKDLDTEATTADEIKTMRLFWSKTISTLIAYKIIQRSKTLDRHLAKLDETVMEDHTAEISLDQESDVPLIIIEEQEALDMDIDQIEDVIRFLTNSKAYTIFKRRLLQFAHEPYRRRISKALQDEAFYSKGKELDESTRTAMCTELSWIPPKSFAVATRRDSSVLEFFKGWIEDKMGEDWDWWPMAPRFYRLRQGQRRLHWRTPGGAIRFIDVPNEAVDRFRNVIQSHPAFLACTGTYACPNISPGSNGGAAAIPKFPQSSTALPTSNSAASAFPGAGQSNSKPSQTITTSQPPNTTANPPTPPEPRHVYLGIKPGSTNHVLVIHTHLMSNDIEFFRDLKSKYLQTRGFLRNQFSMWRYDHCQFVRFRKYGINLCEPTRVDFPHDTDVLYDFDPRPMDTRPPDGPISEGEFRDHFYKSCHPCHSWHRCQMQRWVFDSHNTGALQSLPKRIQELELRSGRREEFWGIAVRERRCFAWVLGYAVLCNLPGTVFFFLWLFRWKHAADLQDASVPVMLSLSFTIGFVTLLYESREGQR